MKKFIALFICIMMLAATAVSTSAAGEILWHEDFSDGFTNPNNWILEGNLFFCDDTDPKNLCVAAYADGVVNQMNYKAEGNPSARAYTNCAMVCRVQVRDFDRDGDHKVGLWWRDDFTYAEGEECGEVYTMFVNMDTNEVELWVEGIEAPIATSPVTGLEVGGDWFTMGWRIVPGNISCYVNNQKLINHSSADIAATAKSPILLWNTNCFSAWDDVVVATADYNLFGEADVNPTPGPVESQTQAPATSRVENVEVTDDKGNAVTDEAGNKVTEQVIITDAPVADTNANAGVGGNSTSTGDNAFIVVAAMVAAFGCALVVKKVTIR